MQRAITGFRQDDVGDWVAELDCHHAQHVRHRPPFAQRPWVETAEGRAGRVGTSLDCPLCDRAELPTGLVVARTVGPFDESSLPTGLARDHRVARGTWGLVRVLSGRVLFTMQTEPAISIDLGSGDTQPIPPGVLHAVALTEGSLEVDFLVPPSVDVID